MAKSRELFLFFQYYITDRAVAAVGKSRIFTGWFCTFINHLRMTGCRNFFLVKLSADTADHSLQAWCLTAAFIDDIFFICMLMIRIIVVVNRGMINIFLCQTEFVPLLL